MSLNKPAILIILIALLAAGFFLARGKRRKGAGGLNAKVFILCALLIIFTLAGAFYLRTRTEPVTAEKVHVEYVIDGDTFVCKEGEDNVKVRLIGVDTPESVSSNVEDNCEEGEIASAYTKALLTDCEVWLEYDEGLTDKYGRTLAYVYLDEELTDMLQKRLLKEGMARVMTVKPNTKYAEEFSKIEAQAQADNIGFWADYFRE